MAIQAVGGAASVVVPQESLQQAKLQVVEGKQPGVPPESGAKVVPPATEAEQVASAAEKINDTIKAFTTDLQFSVDKDTNRVIVKVLDKESGEVIRQIPPDEVISIAKALDTIRGLIIRKKA